MLTISNQVYVSGGKHASFTLLETDIPITKIHAISSYSSDALYIRQTVFSGVYVWGESKTGSLPLPTLSGQSLPDALTTHSKSLFTPTILDFDYRYWAETFQSFDSPASCDLKFTFPEQEIIHTHREFLKSQLDYI